MGAPGWLWLVLGCVPAESDEVQVEWRWPAADDALPAHNRLLWVGLRGEAGPLEWRLDGALLEGEEELREDGRVLHLAAPIPEGTHTLEVVAGQKPARWEGQVEANLPPQLTLEAGSWREGEPVELHLWVEDGDDAMEALSLSGTGEGAALLPAVLPADGRLSWLIWPQEAGFLDVTVTDSLGATAQATAQWELLDEDGDEDGWPTTVDCDDANAEVYPGQSEWCDGVDQDCDGQVDELALDATLWFVDGDGDFFGDAEQAFLSCDGAGGVALGQDCDDSRAGSFPGGTELCDGLDNDCDGSLDEENPTELLPWYHDDDGDGFGDPADVVSACAAPPGRVADASDCNDQDRSAFPGAPESCDGDDEDCDGQADEPDAVDAATWYADTDGDGYGGSSSTVACTAPAGYLANNQDCDDTSVDVSPVGTETCDLRDEDCDGLTDEPDALGAPTWYADTDGDGYGGSSSTVACTAPAGYQANNQDCDDTSSDVSPVGTETCDGRDEDCDGQIDEADAIDAATWYADTDGDGYGGAGSTVACTAPAGYQANNQDCDDTSADVSPVGTETCDLRDEDCDGQIDEPDAIDAATWYADTDGDGYGGSSSTVACTAPAGYQANNQDCDDTSADVSPVGTETCDGRDEDCNGQIDESTAIDAPTWYADTDGDGYGSSSSTVACTAPAGYQANNQDCDDTSSDVSPAGTETCDGRDEDCNGQIDESTAIDAPTWYADTDGDGYGSSSSTVACTAPAGYQANNQDCDDTSSDVSPAGTETCDGRDEDCDGLTDESSAINAPTWYADTDGDGYGGASSTVACTAPSGYLSNNQDCDDTSADVSPAGTESCDGRDEDCDGLTDESSAIDAPTWYADTDGDGYGGASSTVACTRPSGYLANNQDCDDTLADVSPAELESCTNRRDDDCDGQIDGCPLSVTEAVALSGESGSLFSQVESGDLDGDGAVEVGVGGGELLWLLPGDYQQPGTVSGQSPRISGSSLSAFLLGGDRNGDAVAELWWASASESPGGVVWVLDQPSGSGDLGSLAQLRLEGQAGEEFGSALGQIDYDFDGIHELMVGAPGGSGPGLIYAWNLADTGSLSSANADAVLSGAQAGDRAGGGALGAADLDQDGVEDLWVGTPGAGSGAGGLALVRRWEGLPMDLSMADVLWTGNPGEAAGSVVQAADLDLDGYPELLVGTAASSRLYVLPGPLFASGLLEESGARVEGSGGLGTAVADFGVHGGSALWGAGAPGADVDGTGSGGVYLFLGLPEGVYTAAEASWVLAGAGGGAGVGGSLAAAGDADGDGQPELAVGATGGGIWLYSSTEVE